jgi:hypothetical protein
VALTMDHCAVPSATLRTRRFRDQFQSRSNDNRVKAERTLSGCV